MRVPIVIAGGGFTGAATAVQLVRASAVPLAITIVEPRPEVGRGVAYTSDDPDHRLNGSAGTHLLDPREADALERWAESSGVRARDPEALAANGQLYIRRSDFGRFVAEQVDAHGDHNGSTIRHVRDRATDAREIDGGVEVVTASGGRLGARLLVLATGNGGARLPWPFSAPLAAHSGVIADASRMDRVRAIPMQARVLVLGAGLTALDVLSTLVRRGHAGPITALSRQGLRPRAQRPPGADTTSARLFQRIDGPVPSFIANAPRSARGLLRAMRERIDEVRSSGGEWYGPFDDLRDVLWKVWPGLPLAEQRRFLRRLRPWYDAHRFRAPPQNDALVRDAEARGIVVFRRGRLRAAGASGSGVRVGWTDARSGTRIEDTFDVVVNCTGLDPSCGAADNPLLASLVKQGVLAVHGSGLGFDVDAQCRPLGRHGQPVDWLRMLGPPTAGTFGDPLGTLFIAPQIRRALPGMLARIGTSPPA